MPTELVLHRTHATGPLVPNTLVRALAPAFVESGVRVAVHGQELRLARALPIESGAAPAFLLDFAGQGARVKGAAHGPSEDLFAWSFHAVAAALKCPLFEVDGAEPIDAAPADHLEAALAYLARYEADVRATPRGKSPGEDGVAFVAWLAREEHIALAANAVLDAALPIDDAPAFYAMLLESAVVDDVFVSERELASLRDRFFARFALP